jgi:hypothetical protein
VTLPAGGEGVLLGPIAAGALGGALGCSFGAAAGASAPPLPPVSAPTCDSYDDDLDTARYEKCTLVDTTYDCVYECPVSQEYKRIPRSGGAANDNACPSRK